MDTAQTPQPAAPQGNKLSSSLNLQQMQQNIDAMQAQKVGNDQIQSYVDNYEKGADGNYTLKIVQQGTGQDTTFGQSALGEATEKTGADYSSAVPNFMAEAGKTGPSVSKNPIVAAGENALGATASGVGTVFAPITNAVKSFSDTLANSDAGKSIEQNPVMGKILDVFGGASDKLNQFAQAHPEAARDLNNLFTVGTAAVGGEEGTADKPIAELPTAEDIKAGAGKVVEGAKTVVNAPIEAVKGIKNIASDIATPLDARIKTMIDNTTPEEAPQVAQQLKTYLDQARTSVKTNEATPYETAGKTQISKALDTLKAQLTNSGEKMNSELEGLTTPIDHTTAEQALNSGMQDKLGSIHESNFEPSKFNSLQESADYIKNLEKNSKGLSTTNDEPVSGNIYNAPGRTSRISSPTDRNLIDAAYNSLDRIKNGGNTPKQIEDEVSILQNKLANSKGTGVKPIVSPAQGVVTDFVAKLKDSLNENTTDVYKTAREQYAKIRPLYDELNQKVGKNYKNAASIAKQAFSPVSSTRDLLQRVEESTGVPIFNHLNMAKFAMEVAHDPRVASLLEQGNKVIKGVGGLKLNEPMSWLKSAQSLLENPEGKAMRLLDKKGK